jgi:hypothetical protein
MGFFLVDQSLSKATSIIAVKIIFLYFSLKFFVSVLPFVLVITEAATLMFECVFVTFTAFF